MHKITAIKAQVRAGARYSIYINNIYAFSLSEAGLLEHKLVVGQELDDAAVKQLRQLSSEDKLYGQVLKFAAIRPRSEWEFHTYLHRKHVSPALEQKLLNKLSELKLVNDQNFAQSWVDSRRFLRSASMRKLQQELRAKHVGDEVIASVLSAETFDERASLRDLAITKRTRYPNKLKLMQYLSRQGFHYEDIKSVMSELDEAA